MSSIVQRSLRSFSWTAGAQIIVVGVGFVRSVLLARLLDVETFGLYAGATAIVGLLSIPAILGLPAAFLHRAPEIEDEDRAAAVYLTLQTIVTLLWLTITLPLMIWFATGASRTAMIVITIATAIEFFALPAQSVLNRRVSMGRIAQAQVISTLAVSILALLLALNGAELWALLSSDIVAAIILFVIMNLWKPAWRPRFAFDRSIVAYYLRFGIPAMLSQLMEYGLQKFDDLYVRYMLGVSEMGYYSRAYAFASYPRAILATPVALVAGSTFAEVAADRLKLSKAFFRTSAFLIRTGFLLGTLLLAVAPEFVAILLGDKWLPMVPLFRLFIVFVLVDPLRDVLANLFIAVGAPRRLLGYRLVQLVVLLIGLWLLGARFGANGVAIAVNIMLVVGLALMFARVRRYVDFSLLRLFGAPLLAALVAVGALLILSTMGFMPLNLWASGIVKSATIALLYGGILMALEYNELRELTQFALKNLSRKPAAKIDQTSDE